MRIIMLPTVLKQVLMCRKLLPKYMPGGTFGELTEDVILSALSDIESDVSTHNIRVLNDWLIGKYGNNLPSTEAHL